MQEPASIKVYYNSACPICKAGIEWQKGKPSRCPVQWLDVHTDNRLATELHADLETVRERLHVIDAGGALRVGFEALLVIWRNTPGEKWKAILLGLPLIRSLCSAAYTLFAARLYRWNRGRGHW